MGDLPDNPVAAQIPPLWLQIPLRRSGFRVPLCGPGMTDPNDIVRNPPRVRALIQARSLAAMTQEQVAAAMGTTQAAKARLESGRTLPSTRTLKRFADATGLKLRIGFER